MSLFSGCFQLFDLRAQISNDGTVGGIGFFIFLEAVLEFGNLARLGGNGSGAAWGRGQVAPHEDPDNKGKGVETNIFLTTSNNGIDGGAGDTCGVGHFLVSDALLLISDLIQLKSCSRVMDQKNMGQAGVALSGQVEQFS